MRRKALIVFIVWQAIGVLGACLWQVLSSMGAQLWAAGFLLLLPGNIIAGKLVESVFWQRLSLRTIGVLELVAAVAVNFGVWSLVAWIARKYRVRRMNALG